MAIGQKFKYRRALTALRISAHKLEIETGRHANKKRNTKYTRREERFCKLCLNDNVHLVGDEYHALIVCPSFEKKRANLFNTIMQKVPNFHRLSKNEKTMYLLTSEDRDIVIKLSKFIQIILSAQRSQVVKGSNSKKKVK